MTLQQLVDKMLGLTGSGVSFTKEYSNAGRVSLTYRDRTGFRRVASTNWRLEECEDEDSAYTLILGEDETYYVTSLAHVLIFVRQCLRRDDAKLAEESAPAPLPSCGVYHVVQSTNSRKFSEKCTEVIAAGGTAIGGLAVVKQGSTSTVYLYSQSFIMPAGVTQPATAKDEEQEEQAESVVRLFTYHDKNLGTLPNPNLTLRDLLNETDWTDSDVETLIAMRVGESRDFDAGLLEITRTV